MSIKQKMSAHDCYVVVTPEFGEDDNLYIYSKEDAEYVSKLINETIGAGKSGIITIAAYGQYMYNLGLKNKDQP